MHQIEYAMRFIGKATAASADGSVLHAETAAPSSALICRVDATGLGGSLTSLDGGAGHVHLGGDLHLSIGVPGDGCPHLRPGKTLRFSTVGNGYLAPSADSARKHGVVMWRVDHGEGQFAEASGLNTSNFFVDDQLGVVDHHFGVILFP